MLCVQTALQPTAVFQMVRTMPILFVNVNVYLVAIRFKHVFKQRDPYKVSGFFLANAK